MSKDMIITGLQQTIKRQKEQNSALQKENTRLKKDLGILEKEGFIEEPSLPAIVYDFVSFPVCEKHGATLAYDNGYYRCESCKTSIQLVVPHRK